MPDQQFHRSELKFLATFEQAAVGIAHVAPDGTWLRVNGRLCEILGYRLEELMGMNFQGITHPEDLAHDLKMLQAMLERKIDRYDMEKRYIHKEGHSIWANLTVSLVWKTPDEPDYFISVVEDISRRKAAEQEVERLRHSLIEIQETERRFIALELHDELGQRLAAANIALGLAMQQPALATAEQQLRQAKTIIEGLMKTTRNIAQQLHPAQLSHFGLRSAIRSLIKDLDSQGNLKVRLQESIGNRRFSSTTELCAYRVVQEALSNALRHSQATEIDIDLRMADEHLAVEIRDSGTGFQINNTPASGLGLIGMKERILALGGTLNITSKAQCGTCVAFCLPWTSPN